MTEAAEHCYAVLTEGTIAATVTGGVFWELAEEDSDDPFVTYSLEDSGPVSKDRFAGYRVKVRIFAKTLTQASDILKTVRGSVKENTSWRDRGATSGYTDAQAKEAFIEVIYEFKL